MFSDKNYGIPKDLIEAAKRVHEKQLEENLDKSIKKPENKDPDFTKFSKEIKPAFERIENQRKKDLKSEEVQFTEEELAEAFAIFLEENFHVEMLTEEDLDYVFEEEFPQWLEEWVGNAIASAAKYAGRLFTKKKPPTSVADEMENLLKNMKKLPPAPGTGSRSVPSAVKNGAGSVRSAVNNGAGSVRSAVNNAAEFIGKNPRKVTAAVGSGAAGGVALGIQDRQQKSEKSKPKPKPTQTGYEGDLTGANEIAKKAAEAAAAVKSDTMGGHTSAPKPKSASAPTPTARKQVSAKPAASSRKQTGGPSLFQQAKKAVRPTPGDSGRTATDRLKYMARRGNKASQKALRGPKKDWRSSVFNPDGN